MIVLIDRHRTIHHGEAIDHHHQKSMMLLVDCNPLYIMLINIVNDGATDGDGVAMQCI